MGVDSRHPLYIEFEQDYRQMRDTYRGERIVKQAGTRYLPATSGMIADGMEGAESPGRLAYDAYRKRAVFPSAVRDAVEALIGVMHHKPPTIELPAALEPLRDRATSKNESLELLLRRINEEQLVTGRAGLLADVIDKGERKDQPYLALYHAEALINFDEGRADGIEVQNLNFVAIDESEFERTSGFEWERVEKYRVLVLAESNTEAAMAEVAAGNFGPGKSGLPEGEGVYATGIFREDKSGFRPDKMVVPTIRGRSLNRIPFVFINTKDIVVEPDDPPLLGLSNIALAIYRGEADYRQALFMQGQDTLVVMGGKPEDVYRIGSGASINLPLNGDAKMIGAESEGLAEMREALTNDYDRAAQKGGNMLDTIAGGSSQQSGEALRIRMAARTATLNQVALAGAYGLQEILRIVATWVGANPEEVVVLPNLDFADDEMTGKQLTELMAGKQMGAPISLKSVHAIMQRRGLTEFSLEEELELIEAERERADELMGPRSSNPDGQVDDEGDPADDEGPDGDGDPVDDPEDDDAADG